MNDLPNVPLCVLSVRTSQRTGKSYLAGYLGKARVVGFQGDADKYGCPTFTLYLQSIPEQREPQRGLVTVDGDPT